MVRVGKKLCICFIFILMIMISGCRPVKEAELYGTYITKYPFGGTEKLVLYSNGEYSQEVNVVVGNNSKTITNKGRWKYNLATRHLTLDKALVVDNGFGKLKEDYNIPFSGSVMQQVSRFSPWSPIKISTTCEGVFYKK